MAGLAERRQQFAHGRGRVHRLDVGARHHDVVHAHVAKLEDGAQHGALFGREGREGGAARLVLLQCVLDLGAGGAVAAGTQQVFQKFLETPARCFLGGCVLAPGRSAGRLTGNVGHLSFGSGA
jgi:hypothetical protein